MSRRKKQQRGGHKAPKRALTPKEETERLLADTLATFTCASEISHDFLHQCIDELETLDCTIDYNQLAVEMWGGHSDRMPELVATLSDYLAARERHRAVLIAIKQRLEGLIATPHHEHLDPNEWREAVSKRVLFVPAPT